MKKYTIVFVILACITMSGCLVSALHPFYTNKDKIYDETFLGNWMDNDSSLWVIKTNWSSRALMSPEILDSTFNVTYYDDDKKAILKGTMFQLDGKRYMDFTPDPDEEHCMSDMTSYHHLPVHTLARIETKGDQILLFWFGEEWLDELFEENRIRIAHETVDIGTDYRRHILTAPTEELQKFIIKYANAEQITREIDAAYKKGEAENHLLIILSPHDGPIPELD